LELTNKEERIQVGESGGEGGRRDEVQVKVEKRGRGER